MLKPANMQANAEATAAVNGKDLEKKEKKEEKKEENVQTIEVLANHSNHEIDANKLTVNVPVTPPEQTTPEKGTAAERARDKINAHDLLFLIPLFLHSL
jgi:DUF4097 and DUF4098 domain-containing protein YvlB